MDTDVLVVGAGPVGLTMACELARHGVRVRIVDSAPSPSDTSRAVAIHARTLEMLFQMDLEEEFFAQGVVIRSLQFHTGLVALGQFFFDEVDGPYRCVLDVPQNITDRLLSQKLAAFGIVVDRPVKLLQFAGGDSGVVADLQHSDGST